jgi:hypothetical protein
MVDPNAKLPDSTTPSIVTEDPSRQISYLRQCLSSNKKPLGLFLGAGCPMAIRVGENGCAPLIPDIAGITRQVQHDLQAASDCAPLLQSIDGHFQKDGRSTYTIEDILTHVRSLLAVAGKDTVRGLTAANLDLLDTRICDIIHRVVQKDLPGPSTPYHHVAAWAHAIPRTYPVEVFTTNYDLLLEQAFEDVRVPYFDGFAGVRCPFFDLRAMEEDQIPSRWARLWKLHGSINWYQVEGKGVFRGTPIGGIKTKPVIHPSHLKYQDSRRMPYLAMLDRLRAFLKNPAATLVLSGYSFRDEHINEVLVQNLEATQTSVAFALMYDKIASYPEAENLARLRPNLNVLARDGAVIGGQSVRWPSVERSALSHADSLWLRWTPSDPKFPEARLSAELRLGDFAALGSFLQELAGEVRQGKGHPNA